MRSLRLRANVPQPHLFNDYRCTGSFSSVCFASILQETTRMAPAPTQKVGPMKNHNSPSPAYHWCLTPNQWDWHPSFFRASGPMKCAIIRYCSSFHFSDDPCRVCGRQLNRFGAING
eukprot:s223_g60.t1